MYVQREESFGLKEPLENDTARVGGKDSGWMMCVRMVGIGHTYIPTRRYFVGKKGDWRTVMPLSQTGEGGRASAEGWLWLCARCIVVFFARITAGVLCMQLQADID